MPDLRVIHTLVNCVISDRLEQVAVVIVAAIGRVPAAGRATRDGECLDCLPIDSSTDTFLLISVLTRVNQKWKSSRLIGPPIRLAKFVPLSIRSISSRRFIKKFARESQPNLALSAMKSKLLVELSANKLLSISRFARECLLGANETFLSLLLVEHCSKVQTNRCAGECGCEQKYKWHRLLAYDPDNDCKGIFMDWFLFPSCCVCRCNPL
jgi:Spaetzle